MVLNLARSAGIATLCFCAISTISRADYFSHHSWRGDASVTDAQSSRTRQRALLLLYPVTTFLSFLRRNLETDLLLCATAFVFRLAFSPGAGNKTHNPAAHQQAPDRSPARLDRLRKQFPRHHRAQP